MLTNGKVNTAKMEKGINGIIVNGTVLNSKASNQWKLYTEYTVGV
tara:strand:- start:236 stop:370 length:135 start_codon:yes stop_codon:yes gene_type:complete